MVMPMVSIEMDDEDQYDAPVAAGRDSPRFPSGCAITLDAQTLKKLGHGAADYLVGGETGGVIHAHFLARVTHCSHNDSGGSVTLQIEDLAIESEDEENENG